MIPIIAIDGPSGSGKGTLARLLAERLGWHLLDSGALYRAVAWAAVQQGLDLDEEQAIAELAADLRLEFTQGGLRLAGEEIGNAIRSEAIGAAASRIAALPRVRAALLDWQRRCARPPGLVADGRDMGTLVFPEARLKIFLDASPEVRAERRYKQLKEKGLDASLPQLIADIRERDRRDRERPIAPLRPAADAVVIDSTQMSIAEVFERALQELRRLMPEAVTAGP